MRHIRFEPRLSTVAEGAQRLSRASLGSSTHSESAMTGAAVMRKSIRSTRMVPSPVPSRNAVPKRRKTISVSEYMTLAATPATGSASEPTQRADRTRAKSAVACPVVSRSSSKATCDRKYGRSELHQAVRQGNVDQIQHLLKTQPEQLRARDTRGNQPLHYAVTARVKHAPYIVYLLLNAGAFVNAVNDRQQTPLLLSVITSQDDNDLIVRMLLRHDANPKVRVSTNRYLSDYAAQTGLRRIAAALLAHM